MSQAKPATRFAARAIPVCSFANVRLRFRDQDKTKAHAFNEGRQGTISRQRNRSKEGLRSSESKKEVTRRRRFKGGKSVNGISCHKWVLCCIRLRADG